MLPRQSPRAIGAAQRLQGVLRERQVCATAVWISAPTMFSGVTQEKFSEVLQLDADDATSPETLETLLPVGGRDGDADTVPDAPGLETPAHRPDTAVGSQSAHLQSSPRTAASSQPATVEPTPTRPVSVQLMWPRRLGSWFRISVACASRLQATARRMEPRSAYVAQSSGALNVLQYSVQRAIVERKFRFCLRRQALMERIDEVVKRSLFLDEREMDFMDHERYGEYLRMRRKLEGLYLQLREAQMLLLQSETEHKQVVAYEDKLYNDLTRGGGGGLVRQLGGQRAARKVLDETQHNMERLQAACQSRKDLVSRLGKDIKWMFEGNFDSLLACEELVQDGHLRCCPGRSISTRMLCRAVYLESKGATLSACTRGVAAPASILTSRVRAGEYVTIADRYKDSPKFKHLAKDVGKLTRRHSEGSWWVHFEVTGVEMGFATGGEGIFHLKYTTNAEMQKTRLAVQHNEREALLAATAAAVIAAEASALTKGPSSLTYNRNPVVCYYNIPVAEFVTSEDLRNAARAVNHAACLDPRDRVLSARVVNAITASCWGKEPFTFSWKPKAPAVYPPLGLAIDERSGQVTGTPRFHGEVAVLVTCTDADGFSSYTQLRFFCKDPPTGAALPLSPPIVLRSHPLEGI